MTFDVFFSLSLAAVILPIPNFTGPSWLDGVSSVDRVQQRYRIHVGHGFESRSSLTFFRLYFHTW